MSISVFDLFKIGIGPSSSHTVGPMKAARRFVLELSDAGQFENCSKVRVELYGSLSLTGPGHGTPKAIILGLEGKSPETVDGEEAGQRWIQVNDSGSLLLGGTRQLEFDHRLDLVLHHDQTLPFHSNGMRFSALDSFTNVLLEKVYYSVGGGFILSEEEAARGNLVDDNTELPYPFTSASQLLEHCRKTGMRISSLMLANEQVWQSRQEIDARLDEIWGVMQACIDRGCEAEGIMPGGLGVRRRAAQLYRKLKNRSHQDVSNALAPLDWVTLYALAVNEENAAGGRVVTAPTNGAAGIIPAVLRYYMDFTDGAEPEDARRFLLTAGAIGILYKVNASISGAEVGCQGEVGSACSMAAGALAEVMGATIEQVENAAEIGMEHNLGLTCDPVGGLVQVPCIERNAMAAIKAISAARIALHGDGEHLVSLDQVIRTMRDTGRDMQESYKETARGGLAVNVIAVPVSVVDC